MNAQYPNHTKLPWSALEKAHILVVGLGKTGLSAARYLASQSSTVTLWDTRAQPDNIDSTAIPSQANLVCGEQTNAFWESIDGVVLSPGVSPKDGALTQIKHHKIQIIGDVELFALALSQQPKQPKLIGITGSNGKTTCTLLITHILKQAGINVAAVGNVGMPVLDVFKTLPDVIVLELSSFQLEMTDSLNLDIACYLNLTEDHLDRHGSMHEYGEAKQRIYNNAKHGIFWREQKQTYPHNVISSSITFGLEDAATGWSMDKCGNLCCSGAPFIHESELPVAGLHNALNVMACGAMAKALDIEDLIIRKAVESFEPPAHRCVTISRNRGIQWIDDSKATNPGATLAALKGIAPQVSGNLLLIAGGVSKGADFTVLKQALQQHVNMLIAFGQDADQLLALHQNAIKADDLQNAVELAYKNANQNDAVLLSPACASLDMFDNYEHRARVFAQAIERLAA